MSKLHCMLFMRVFVFICRCQEPFENGDDNGGGGGDATTQRNEWATENVNRKILFKVHIHTNIETSLSLK